VVIQLSLFIVLQQSSLAQDWGFRVKPRGTLKVADMFAPSVSGIMNYAEAYVPY
jgi:hypothetical protein